MPLTRCVYALSTLIMNAPVSFADCVLTRRGGPKTSLQGRSTLSGYEGSFSSFRRGTTGDSRVDKVQVVCRDLVTEIGGKFTDLESIFCDDLTPNDSFTNSGGESVVSLFRDRNGSFCSDLSLIILFSTAS